VVLPGERHDLKKDPAAVANAALDWLTDLVATSSRAEKRSTS
jgi:hypothetical protein